MFERKKSAGKIYALPIESIQPSPFQARTHFDEQELAGLAASIRENGLLQPIAVRKKEDGYELVAGERRLRACKMAKMQTIPAILCDYADDKTAAMGLLENLQREDLNPLEEAEGYRELMDRFHMTQEEVARKVGKSRPAVANALRLLGLPEPVRELVRTGELSQGHARTLLGLSKEETLIKAAETVLTYGLSVRQTEKLVKRLEQLDQGEEEEPILDEGQIYIDELEHRLAQVTGRKISISQGKGKGRITIEYYGNEDLESLTQVIYSMKKQ